MKKLALIILLALCVVSCKKEEEVPPQESQVREDPQAHREGLLSHSQRIGATSNWDGAYIYRVHDDSLNVTCWVVGHDGISCMADSQIAK